MPNWKKIILSGSAASLSNISVDNAVTGSNLSVTDTATYNTVEFVNSNIMKFNQRYTGAAAGSYFTNGEYQKVVTITPSAASQNYQVVGRMTAQNAGETHTVYFNAALRSNTLPDLDWTINYNEEYNGGRYIDPQLWVKETTTAGFIIAFKTLGTIYGSVTIDFDVIPRSADQKANVSINQVLNSEQTSIDTGFTAYDMQRNQRNQNGNFTISGSVTAESFAGDGSALTNISAQVTEQATITDTFTSVTTKAITHNFGTKNVLVSVYNNSDELIIPASTVTTSTSVVTVTFDTATTGRAVVAKGGHLVSGSAVLSGTGVFSGSAQIDAVTRYEESITGASTYTITHNLGEDYPIVQVYDTNKFQALPGIISASNANSVYLGFDSNFTGRVVIKK
jgi:hypothetical protein